MTEPIRRRDDCRLCGGRDLPLALALTPTPPANAFVRPKDAGAADPVFPLDVHFCADCGHVQLRDVVDPALLFENYVYVSSTSAGFVRHFEALADDLATMAPAGGFAVEIGSNDGVLLRPLAARGLRVLGVDPARAIAARASAEGLPTLPAFFDSALARRIRAEHGPADLVVANNVFAHADDLADIADGVAALLAPGGVFLFEVSYLLDVIEKTLFDTIYHEHLAYHALGPLKPFFAAHGLMLFDARRIDSHGGSLRGFVQRADGPRPVVGRVDTLIAAERAAGLDRLARYHAFGRQIDQRGRELRALLHGLKAGGAAIAGYGAPAKATTLCHHFGLGPDLIAFIVDDSPWKQGLLTPGLRIPVLAADAIEARRPDYLLVLAWNFAESIIAKTEAHRARGGRFVTPLPDLRVA